MASRKPRVLLGNTHALFRACSQAHLVLRGRDTWAFTTNPNSRVQSQRESCTASSCKHCPQCPSPSRHGEVALLLVPSWSHQRAGPLSSPSTRRRPKRTNGRTGEGQWELGSCAPSTIPVSSCEGSTVDAEDFLHHRSPALPSLAGPLLHGKG